eukprot:CAMPEP_0198663186 /NCGR_PEP_ID=MMETSP1467-20131203/50809_1 /TAXON_ID=1462469 /ORGANISM="unid. sp., Strain CCMP2135" /LENGTH=590 /DNA_ID=CAMNT_0044399699 /DNA_START=25 /DNA_END=1794 /DNA_ORIENTATION=-
MAYYFLTFGLLGFFARVLATGCDVGEDWIGAHWRRVRRAEASERTIPLYMLPVLRDLDLGCSSEMYEALIEHQQVQANISLEHMACADLKRVREAKHLLPGRAEVFYSSSSHGVVCWSAPLRPIDADALAERGKGLFLHVATLPALAKLDGNGGADGDFNDGIKVALLHHTYDTPRAVTAAVARRWNEAKWALDEKHLSSDVGCEVVLRLLRDGQTSMSSITKFCAMVSRADARLCFSDDDDESFTVTVDPDKATSRDLRLEFSGTAKATCAPLLAAFLVAQNDVATISPLPRSINVDSAEKYDDAQWSTLEDGQHLDEQRRLLDINAVQWLLGDNLMLSRLTSLGVTGKGQVVQVVDSGVDDASCFFQNTCPPQYNGGSVCNLEDPTQTTINYFMQVMRSEPNNEAAFDNSKRKVVQYYGFPDLEHKGRNRDDVHGHGTRVASVLAGSLDPASSFASTCETVVISTGNVWSSGEYKKDANTDDVYVHEHNENGVIVVNYLVRKQDYTGRGPAWAVYTKNRSNSYPVVAVSCTKTDVEDALLNCPWYKSGIVSPTTLDVNFHGMCLNSGRGVAPDAKIAVFDNSEGDDTS